MEKLSLFSILFKKTIKGFKSEIKQFLQIIAIITIAVTLFVGLQANYQSLKQRVDNVYKEGNMGSYWLSYGLIDSTEEKRIYDLMTFDVDLTSRYSLSGKVESITSNVLIFDNYPTVAKPYKLYIDDNGKKDSFIEVESTPKDEDDFFLIEQRFFKFAETTERESLSASRIADKTELEVVFSISSYREIIQNLCDSLIKPIGYELVDEEINLLKTTLDTYINNYFDEHQSLSFKTPFTNYMSSPENLAIDQTSTPNTMMSRKRFLKCMTPIIDEAISGLEDAIADAGLKLSIEQFIGFEAKKYINKILTYNNQIVLKVREDRHLNDANRILNEYIDSLKYEENDLINRFIYMTDLNTLPSNLTIQNDIQQAYYLSFAFPIIFLLVAILIVITTITQLIIKERTQIGTLKGLGISKKEITLHYLITTLFLGFVGCLLGLILGPIILPRVMDIKYLILYSISPTSFTFPVAASLITFIAVLAIIALITILITRKELKTSPVESMRPAVPKISFKSTSTKEKNVRFISFKIAIRNIRVYLAKSIMVVVGILGCTALLVCGFGIDDTLQYGKNLELTNFYGYDIVCTYSNYNVDPTSEIENYPGIAENLNHDGTYRITLLPSTYYAQEGTSYAVTSYIFTQKVLDDRVIKLDWPADTVAVAKSNAEKIGVKVGDEINIKILDKKYTRKVGYIYENFFLNAMMFHAEDSINDYEISYLANNYITSGYFHYKDGITEKEKADTIALMKNLNLGISSVDTKEDLNNTIETYFSAIKMMTLTIKIFAILLAIVCLINLALLNFRERMRNIATLKVLGFSVPEISRSLIYESTILTSVGAAIGLGLGLPFEYIVLSVNQNNFISFIYKINTETYILAFFLALITSFVVNLVLSIYIRKVPMVESLKSVE